MFKIFLPEIFLITSFLFLLVFDSHLITRFKFNFPVLEKEILWQTQLIFLFTLFLVANTLFEGSTINDLFVVTNKVTTILSIFLVIVNCITISIWRGFIIQRLNLIEYFILYAFAVTASIFLLFSCNLLSIYLCLEMQSLCFYILSAAHKTSIFASEAGLKYFTSSATVSCFYLCGCFIIYSVYGTTCLSEIALLVSTQTTIEPYAFSGFCFIVGTFLFKLTIAPFHVWFPQIYDGAPISSTVMFTVIPKIIFFAILLRIFDTFTSFVTIATFPILIIGIYSIIFGTIYGLMQERLKKILIYSSIGQMGLPLCAMVENSPTSTIIVYFFIVGYTLTSILIWVLFIMLNISLKMQTKYWNDLNNIHPIYITHFSNITKNNPQLTPILLIICFTLAGVPPFLGFLSKTAIYYNIVKNTNIEIALMLAYIGAIGVFYYLRIIKIAITENAATISKLNNLIKTTPYQQLDYTVASVSIFLLCFFCINPYPLFLKLANAVF